ncbi:MAG: YdcF family protein [Gammaproteobacteria bacterium]|nr:YdcF family protein [Gammaproteobacteria bacterium]
MFEVGLTRLFNSTLLPPGSIVVVLALSAGLFYRRPKLARGLLLFGTCSLLLLSLPVVSHLLMRPLQPYPVLDKAMIDQFQPQAIVILAGGRQDYAPEFGGSSVNPYTLHRLLYGVALHRQTGLPILVTGGNEKPNLPAEARLMEKALVGQFGVTPQWVEDKSRTTGENAIFSQALLEPDHIQRVMLVSHAWHLPRAVGVFEQQQLQVLPAPMAFEMDSNPLKLTDFLPKAASLVISYHALHEFIGLAWYRLRY